MSDIFISYASQDRSRAEPLAKALEEQGWSVWWDRTIPPGKTFDEVIEEAINAARCVVVLWSERSIKSDWVKEEANIAKERKILVPARIDPVDLPLGFGRIQAADLTDWEAETSHPGFLSLRNAISEVAGPPPERDKSVQDTKLPESNLEQQLEVKSKESETFQPDPSHLKPVEKEAPIIGPKAPRKKRLAFGFGAVALILILSVIGWYIFSKPASYTITASSGTNGSILPTGPVPVTHGSSMVFKIEPKPGYHIADVVVDGKSVGAKSTHTIKNVTGDSTIEASFAVNSYTIKASSGPNGRISPTGPVAVSHGGSMVFKIEPKPGYHIAEVKVDGRSVGAESTHMIKDVTGDRTIEASFAKIGYTITPTKFGDNGRISPPHPVKVDHGKSRTFNITPNPGYRILDVKVDGKSVGAVSSYTINNVTSDHTIEASFTVNSYTIKSSSGSNGRISPPGSVSVTHGDSMDFKIEPKQGYRIADVKVDGKSVGAKSSYTIENVTRDRTIEASFAKKGYTIATSSGPSGSISPTGPVKLDHGKSRTFTITPNPGYHIADVVVDGKSVGAKSRYTLNDVTSDRTIEASFVQIGYTITASSGPNGSISPPGSVQVSHGDSKRFKIRPNSGYRIADVKVDETSVGAKSSYTIKNVTRDHRISASFELPIYEREAFNPAKMKKVLSSLHEKEVNPKDRITLEAWFNTNSLNNHQWIIDKLPDKTNKQPYYQYHLGLRPGGGLYFALAIDKKRAFIDQAFKGYVKTNIWHHVAATYDGTWMRLYLDGQELRKQPGFGGPLSIYNTELDIGGVKSVESLLVNKPFQGQLAEVRIWEIARSQKEINDNMDKIISANEKGLLWSSTNWLRLHR